MRFRFFLARVSLAIDAADVCNILVAGISGTPGLVEIATLKVNSPSEQFLMQISLK